MMQARPPLQARDARRVFRDRQVGRLVRASALFALGLIVQLSVDEPKRVDEQVPSDTSLQQATDEEASLRLRPVVLQDTAATVAQSPVPRSLMRAADAPRTEEDRTSNNPRQPIDSIESVPSSSTDETSSPRGSTGTTGANRSRETSEPQDARMPALSEDMPPVASGRRIAAVSTSDIRLALAYEPLTPLGAMRLPVPAAFVPADAPRHRETITIRRVIQEYATALGRLDPIAAKRVWPTLDEHALARAFQGLDAQSLTFDECGVTLQGAIAQANCHGRATYLPKVGRRRPLSTTGEWTFNLARTNSEWVIRSAAVQ